MKSYAGIVSAFRHIRRKRGIALNKVARDLSIDRLSVRRFEAGAGTRASNFLKLANYFNLLEPCPLTDWEQCVANLVASDMCRKQIAKELGKSVKSVDSTINSIHRKLGTNGPAGITRWVLENEKQG